MRTAVFTAEPEPASPHPGATASNGQCPTSPETGRPAYQTHETTHRRPMRRWVPSLLWTVVWSQFLRPVARISRTVSSERREQYERHHANSDEGTLAQTARHSGRQTSGTARLRLGFSQFLRLRIKRFPKVLILRAEGAAQQGAFKSVPWGAGWAPCMHYSPWPAGAMLYIGGSSQLDALATIACAFPKRDTLKMTQTRHSRTEVIIGSGPAGTARPSTRRVRTALLSSLPASNRAASS